MDPEKHLALELALENRLRADLDALAVRPYVYYREAAFRRRAAGPGAVGRLFSVARVGATIVVAVLFAVAAAVALLNLRGPSPAASPTPIPASSATPPASPSPTSTSSATPLITVAPTDDATVTVNASRTFTATITNLSGCVDLAFVDANTYPGDGTFRDAGNSVAELSSDATITSINGAPVGATGGTGYFSCVAIPSDGRITFTIRSGTANAHVRPVVFYDEPDNNRFDLDASDRPTDKPFGVGGATLFN
jgi:hypothetical protein